MPDMFKRVLPKIYFFDSEYVPCIETGRRVYRLPDTMSDQEVVEKMHDLNGATPENRRPLLKLFLYKVISLSAVIRERQREGPPKLTLFTLADIPEKEIVGRFLNKIGAEMEEGNSQLVGFASWLFDLTVFFQRAFINGCVLPEFCRRPNKPWEGPDWFSKTSDWHVDLLNVFGGTAKANPKLDEIALAARIPGKLSLEGGQVADAWFAGARQEIYDYNETDACTTYLLWLKTARMAGFVTPEAYEAEADQFYNMLAAKAQAGAQHLADFLVEWDRLEGVSGGRTLLTAPVAAVGEGAAVATV